MVASALALATFTVARAQTPVSGALARIADAGRIRMGYRVDASPFSYRDDAGGPAGYSIALCQTIADAIEEELRLPKLTVEWVPVIDMLCGVDSVPTYDAAPTSSSSIACSRTSRSRSPFLPETTRGG